MFTYIVPFVNIFNKFEEQLKNVCDQDIIEKVVVINNSDKEYIPTFSDKIKVINNLQYNQKSYCNGGWNIGYENSNTEYLILATEDIIFDARVFSSIKELFETTDAEIIGTQEHIMGNTHDPNFKIGIERIPVRSYAYGLFMCIRRKDYRPIPKQIKHWYGDDFLFWSMRNRYHIISDTFRVETVLNSCSQDSTTKSIIDQDLKYGDRIIDMVKNNTWNYQVNMI